MLPFIFRSFVLAILKTNTYSSESISDVRRQASEHENCLKNLTALENTFVLFCLYKCVSLVVHVHTYPPTHQHLSPYTDFRTHCFIIIRLVHERTRTKEIQTDIFFYNRRWYS